LTGCNAAGGPLRLAEGILMTDVLFVLLTVVVFAVLGVLAKGVERL